MKNNLWLILFLVLIAFQTKSQNVFHEALGNSLIYENSDFDAVTFDDGSCFILTQIYNSFIRFPTGWQISIIKTDDDGRICWSKTYRTLYLGIPFHIIKTFDQNLLIVATGGRYTTQSSSSTHGCLFMMKADTSGNILWTKEYDSPPQRCETPQCVIETRDSGIVISMGGCEDHLLLKTDKDGNLLWSKAYPIDSLEVYSSTVAETDDGGFLFSTLSTGQFPTPDIKLIAKLSSTGEVIRAYELKFPRSFYGASIIRLDSNRYVIASGRMISLYDSTGALLKAIGTVNAIRDAILGNNGNLFIGAVGTALSNFALLQEIDTAANTVSFRSYQEDTLLYFPYSVNQTPAGQITLVGIKEIVNNDPAPLFLLKTDTNYTTCFEEPYMALDSLVQDSISPYPLIAIADTPLFFQPIVYSAVFPVTATTLCSVITSVNDNSINDTGEISFFPNPTNGLLTLHVEENKIGTFTVANLIGEVVLTFVKETKNTEEVIDISKLQPGIYILQVLINGKLLRSKVVKN